MRVQLQIDVLWPEDRIMLLGEYCTDQPEVRLTSENFGMTGRLTGASPVEANPDGPYKSP